MCDASCDNEKTAIISFGRMNPPTIGHLEIVRKMKSLTGDKFLFLSHTNKPKTDPLDFDTKAYFASMLFPGINVGDKSVRTVIQALQRMDALGYDNIVFVAGQDRVAEFEKLINAYNTKEYSFNSITVVSAGERDPDSDGVVGMSASKLRQAAQENNFEVFSAGVPDQRLARALFEKVKEGLSITLRRKEHHD
jgi:nicotinic acid mononucleotide adenylyltransferase